VRKPDAGESTASINARGDDASWPSVLAELQTGATLLRVPKLRRAYADRGNGPYGPGISEARIRKLERAGVLRNAGVDRYALVEIATAAATDACPGHVASEHDATVCARCGIHIDELRPDDDIADPT
jgi:hypothetical protein